MVDIQLPMFKCLHEPEEVDILFYTKAEWIYISIHTKLERVLDDMLGSENVTI
jgi:hypothetical protein